MPFPRLVMLAAGVAACAAIAPIASAAAVTPTPPPVPPKLVRDAVVHPTWYPDWAPGEGKGSPQPWPSTWPKPRQLAPTASGSLNGRVIVVDPGHNVGNERHVAQINRHYWVGLDKICNTTGTATRSGYPEASYTYDVAQRLAALLTAQGATVVLTRDHNSRAGYGPCIQARGLLGGQVGADLEVSIHADGGPSSGRGAFVYTPATKTGYTNSTKATRSKTLATKILDGLEAHGLRRSTYLVPNVSPDRQQGTLNVGRVPVVIVETLNMANRRDATIAESPYGRQRVAAGLFDGILGYFAR